MFGEASRELLGLRFNGDTSLGALDFGALRFGEDSRGRFFLVGEVSREFTGVCLNGDESLGVPGVDL